MLKKMIAAALTLLLLTAGALPALAAGNGTVEMTVAAGYGGKYRVGEVLPVVVTVKNNGPEMNGALELLTGNGFSVLLRRAVVLPPQSEKQFVLYADASVLYKAKDLEVALKKGGATVATATPPALAGTDPAGAFCGTLSDDPGAIAYFKNVSLSAFNGSTWTDLAPGDIYEEPRALEAFDLLVVNGLDAGKLTAEQRSAVRRWVLGGGTLLLGTGPGAEADLRSWENLTDGLTVHGTAPVTDLSSLGALGGKDLTGSLPVLRLQQQGWSVEAKAEGGTPLVLRRGAGKGSVIVAAWDLGEGAITGWPGNGQLWRGLLNRFMTDANPYDKGVFAGPSSGVLAALQGGIGGLITFWLFIFVLAVFIVLAGFAGYGILKALNRQKLMWVTVPALAVLFSALLVLCGRMSFGRQPAAVAFSTTDASGGMARSETTVAFLAPSMGDYTLRVPGAGLVQPISDNAASYYQTTPEQSVRLPVTAVQSAEEPEVRFLNVNLNGSRTAQYQSVEEQSPLELSCVYDGTAVNCRVKNTSTYPITDAAVVLGSGSHPLGTLAPGAEQSFQLPLDQTPLDQSLYSLLDQLYPMDYGGMFNRTAQGQDREKTLRGQLVREQADRLAKGGSGTDPLGSVLCLGWLEGGPQKKITINGRAVTPQSLRLLSALVPITQSADGQMLEIVKAQPRLNAALSQGNPVMKENTLILQTGQAAVLDFQLEGTAALALSGLTLETGANPATAGGGLWSLYDWKAQTWTDVEDGRQFTGGELAGYIDPQGLVRARATAQAGDYMECTPYVWVQGVKK